MWSLVHQVKPVELNPTIALILQVRLNLEIIRADVEEFGGKAYRMGKGSKDDAVVALLKDQLDEFKQVHGAVNLQQTLPGISQTHISKYSTGVTAKVALVRLVHGQSVDHSLLT